MRLFEQSRSKAGVVDLMREYGFIQKLRPNEVVETFGYRSGRLFVESEQSDQDLHDWKRDPRNRKYDVLQFSNNEIGLFQPKPQIQVNPSPLEVFKKLIKRPIQLGIYGLANKALSYEDFKLYEHNQIYEIVDLSFHAFKDVVAIASPFKVLFYNLDSGLDFTKIFDFSESQVLALQYSPLSSYLSIGTCDKFFILDLEQEKPEVFTSNTPVESIS